MYVTFYLTGLQPLCPVWKTWGVFFLAWLRAPRSIQVPTIPSGGGKGGLLVGGCWWLAAEVTFHTLYTWAAAEAKIRMSGVKSLSGGACWGRLRRRGSHNWRAVRGFGGFWRGKGGG